MLEIELTNLFYDIKKRGHINGDDKRLIYRYYIQLGFKPIINSSIDCDLCLASYYKILQNYLNNLTNI